MQAFSSADSSVKQALVAMLGKRRLPHAFLIESPSRTNAAELSSFIASLFLCVADLAGINGQKPCGACAPCSKLSQGIHPDVFVVSGEDRANSIHIEAIRQLKADAWLKPNDGEKRIIIIEDAHNMTIAAQNALLKILEEPPPHLVFVLTCNNTANCAVTIVSRCVKLLLSSSADESPASEHAEAAEQFYNALCRKDFFELLAVLSPLEKSKEALAGFFDAAAARLYRAVTSPQGDGHSAKPHDLLQLASVIDILRDASALVQSNVSPGLVCANAVSLISKL